MIGRKLSNRYALREVLGRGGMAVVYLGHDPWLDREVAIKILSTDRMSESIIARFQREARLAASLDHPSIVPIYDFGRHDNHLFFVMPVLRGRTLQQLIGEGSLELSQMLELAAQVAEGLAYSALHGVVHRDIKPSNLMAVARGAGQGTATSYRGWIMDFGLALADSGVRITRTGNLPGTLAYLSPEQVLSQEIDGRADLYALATILYEFLAGGRPFSGPPAAMLYRIVHDPPDPLTWQGVDEPLADLVHRCLAKDPNDRPQGEELAAGLRHYASYHLAGQRPTRHKAQGTVDDGAVELPLVGRREEMRLLKGALQRSQNEGCQLWLLGGEAGFGKSRLLAELEETARRRGHRVLRGRFSDQERAFPYQGFCELIEDHFRQISSEIRSSEGESGSGQGSDGEVQEAADSAIDESFREAGLGDVAAELLTYFPSLREISALNRVDGPGAAQTMERDALGSLGDDEVGEGRLAIFECVARTFSRLAADGPLVLLLENLQVADVSIEMLRYVARRLSSAPLLVVGTFRSDTITRRHPIDALCRSLEEDPCGGHLQLAPLSPEEGRTLAGHLLAGAKLSDELANHLYETSEGNPFFLRELVRVLQDRGELSSDDHGVLRLTSDRWLHGGQLPDTIQQVVEAQLERLDEDDREILAMASILGRSFEFEDLAHLVGDGDRADEAIERLLRGGHLEEDLRSRGDVLRFSSGILRDALYGRLPRRRRRGLHRRFALALEEKSRHRSEPPCLMLMHHFSQADVADKTVHYALLQARQSLQSGSWDDVIRVTNLALEFIEDDPLMDELGEEQEVEGEIRQLLAVALRASGRLQPALRQAEQAVSAVQRHGKPREVAESALLAGEIAWQLRLVDKVQRWVSAGLSALATEGEASPRRKLLLLGATVANLRGDYGVAEALMAEVESLPEEVDGADGRQGGVLVTALPHPVTTLDPSLFKTVEDIEVLANIFETLLRPDFDGHLLPALARQWRGEDDEQAFRFFLDPDAKFSDGTPLVAQGVKDSLQSRASHNTYGCSRTAYAAIQGIDELLAGTTDQLSGIEVVDAHELLFKLKEPLPIFPVLLCGLGTSVVHPLADGTILGTGPFRLCAESDDGDPSTIQLERNPHHHGAPPFLDRLVFRTDLDAAGIAQGLQSGALDVARDLRPNDLDRLLRDARFRSQMVEANLRNVYFIMWNAHGSLARHGALRRALCGVLRVDELIWSTAGRFARPATSLLPPGILGHSEERPEPLSLEAAKGLLAEVPGPRPLRLRVVVHPIFKHRYDAFLRAIQREWQPLGVEVTVEEETLEGFAESWKEPGDIDLCIGRWLPEYDDPDGYTHLLLNSEVGFLAKYLPSDALDEPLLEARRERRLDRREELYRQVEGILRRDDLMLPLFHDVDYRIAHPRVRGMRLLRHPPYVDYRHLSQVSPSEGDATATVAQGGLRIPLTHGLPSLDPLQATLAEVAEVVPNVFETLTRVSADAKVVPHLAERIERQDGGRRFHLRLPVNTRFHDGRRLTSRDVRFSLERLLKSPWAPSNDGLIPLRGAAQFRTGRSDHVSGLRILSEREILLELDQPLVYFPALLALPTTGIVAHGAESFDGDWRQGCVGTGPFRIHRFVPNERLELRAFPGYRRSGFPKCDQLTFELGMTPQSIFERFRGGELCLASHLRPGDVATLRQDPRLQATYHEMPGISTYFMVAKTGSGPLQDRQVRRRLVEILDLDRLVGTTLGSLGDRAHGLIPPGLLTPTTIGELAVEASQQLTELRGLRLDVALNSAYSRQHAPFWKALSTTLERHGVHLEIIADETQDVRRVIHRGEVDLVVTRWLGDYPDADCFVSHLHSRDGVYGSLCGDADLDERIEAARSEADPRVRHAYYREIERRLVSEGAVIPLFHEQVYRLSRPHVGGLRLGFGVPEVAYEELRLKS